jgi:hypothetical protein
MWYEAKSGIGCSSDVANNVLVDPNGDQWECTDTQLLPSDSDQLSTWYWSLQSTEMNNANCCSPLAKNNPMMVSGDWSILILSNNGDGDPIAFERDFVVTVGAQATTTTTPSVTAWVTVTPVVNATSKRSIWFI